MSVRSQLNKCKSCGGFPEVGVSSKYYFLGSRRNQQPNGNLPKTGYCLDCFLKLVTEAERDYPERVKTIRDQVRKAKYKRNDQCRD